MSAEPKDTYPTPAHGWTCFHCGENFPGTMAGQHEARMHFGPSVHSEPKCQISAYRVRQMEDQLRRYREEDTDLHRELRRMESDHLIALRREEEKGYARGLRDAVNVEGGKMQPCRMPRNGEVLGGFSAASGVRGRLTFTPRKPEHRLGFE
jgi:hypothetical protein